MIERSRVEFFLGYLGPRTASIYAHLPQSFWVSRITRTFTAHTNDGYWHSFAALGVPHRILVSRTVSVGKEGLYLQVRCRLPFISFNRAKYLVT